jgi:choice-of-anchor C domain-containing protein
MRKIIRSLAIVIAVGAAAGVATHSYFSDTETSSGNIFTAGAIDLKVDSTAHYNNLVCALNGDSDYVWKEDNCKLKSDDLVSNGSFENGNNPGTFKTLNPGDGDMSDWTVDSGSVDYIGSYWQASDGNRSVDLNGVAQGSISQTINTVDGATYKVTFDLSGNPDSRPAGDSLYSPSNKEISVNAVGSNSESFYFDTSVEHNTLADMKWKSYSYTFVASGTSTVLKFASQIQGAFGPALDNVEVHEEECKTISTSELIGMPCDGTWDLTDLGSAEKFFNFSDIKPGDFGEDTVSLHVTDNDSWGKLTVDVKSDSDNGCNEPELDDESGCKNDGPGELRENLKFSVWLDEGNIPGFQGQAEDPEEGDNIKQDDEIALISAGPIDEGGEEWLISDAIKAAYTANSGQVAPGITEDGHMSPDITYFFGIGWELPEDVGNEVQTDIFSADMTFEAVQYRNNPSQQF